MNESSASTSNGSSSATAAKVLAVVVARNPGDWFEQTLKSLNSQDYENLSVVVVDTTVGTDTPTATTPTADFETRVRAVIPDAAIISAPGSSGFPAAANAVLATDLTSSFLLMCHDDVVLNPDAVTQLVTQAGQNHADVAGPKLLHWNRPEVIQHIGFDVDRFGAKTDMSGADELDRGAA